MEITNKDKSTLDYLVSELDVHLKNNKKPQEYHLYILSCYINIEILDKLRKQIGQCVAENSSSIKETTIFIDKTEALRNDKYKELIKREEEKSNGSLKIRVPKDNLLFHPKAYALISETNQEDSIIFSGSANLTKGGMEKSGNIELIAYHLDKNNVDKFVSLIEDLSGNSLGLKCAYENELNKIKELGLREDISMAFKLNLVSQGYIFKRIGGTAIKKAGLKIECEHLRDTKTTANKKSVKYPFYIPAKEENTEDNDDLKSFEKSSEFQEIRYSLLRFSPAFEVPLEDFSVNLESGMYWMPSFLFHTWEIEKEENVELDISLCEDLKSILLKEQLKESAKNAIKKILNIHKDLKEDSLRKEFRIDIDRNKGIVTIPTKENGNKKYPLRKDEKFSLSQESIEEVAEVKVEDLVNSFTSDANLKKILRHYAKYQKFNEFIQPNKSLMRKSTQPSESLMEEFIEYVYQEIYKVCGGNTYSTSISKKPGVSSKKNKQLLSYVVRKMAQGDSIEDSISSTDFLSPEQYADFLCAWMTKTDNTLKNTKQDSVKICYEKHFESVSLYTSNEEEISQNTAIFVIDRIKNIVMQLHFSSTELVTKKVALQATKMDAVTVQYVSFTIKDTPVYIGIISETFRPITLPQGLGSKRRILNLSYKSRIFGRIHSTNDMKSLTEKIVDSLANP